MAGETAITITGNLTADPETRYLNDGTAVSTFTVASTPRHFDRNANEWKDGETLFLRCNAFRELAENTAETLRKGMSVIVTGTLGQHSYQDRDGNRRTSIELRVDDAGPSLRRARAEVTRNQPRETTGRAASRGNTQGSPNYTQDTYSAPQTGWYGSGPAEPF